MSDEKELLTAEEAARRLNVSRTKVYQLLLTGALRSIKIDRARRIPTSEIGAYIARQLEAHADA